MRAQILEPDFLGWNSGSAMDKLCDLGELLNCSVTLQNRADGVDVIGL